MCLQRLSFSYFSRQTLVAVLGSIGLASFTAVVRAEEEAETEAEVATIQPEDLAEFGAQPLEIQHMIREALDLTSQELTYRFGSHSPENGGMDCSGTVYCVLQRLELKGVPRSSYAMFQWAEARGVLHKVVDPVSLKDPVFDGLKPGDLLFWTGTYATVDRDPPISHVMVYLGTLKEDGRPVIFGASDGRYYRGKRIRGVSVFDFRLPREGSTAEFVAYGPVPGLVPDPPKPSPEMMWQGSAVAALSGATSGYLAGYFVGLMAGLGN